MERLRTGATRRHARVAVLGWCSILFACNADDVARLEPISECESHDECVEADPRYDRCGWVCEGHITYCQVTCEVDDDCLGRGLPSDYVYCDIPRPGEGFCNQYNFDYGDDECRMIVPEIPDT